MTRRRYTKPKGLTDSFLQTRIRSPGAAVGKNDLVSTIGNMEMCMVKGNTKGAKLKMFTGKPHHRRHK
jgi:hypothetical protein